MDTFDALEPIGALTAFNVNVYDNIFHKFVKSADDNPLAADSASSSAPATTSTASGIPPYGPKFEWKFSPNLGFHAPVWEGNRSNLPSQLRSMGLEDEDVLSALRAVHTSGGAIITDNNDRRYLVRRSGGRYHISALPSDLREEVGTELLTGLFDKNPRLFTQAYDIFNRYAYGIPPSVAGLYSPFPYYGPPPPFSYGLNPLRFSGAVGPFVNQRDNSPYDILRMAVLYSLMRNFL